MADHLEPKVGQFFSYQPHKSLLLAWASMVGKAKSQTNGNWPIKGVEKPKAFGNKTIESKIDKGILLLVIIVFQFLF